MHLPMLLSDKKPTIYFKVQVTCRPTEKSKYETRYGTANETQARLLYRGINIGNGYRKRLVCFGPGAPKILERHTS